MNEFVALIYSQTLMNLFTALGNTSMYKSYAIAHRNVNEKVSNNTFSSYQGVEYLHHLSYRSAACLSNTRLRKDPLLYTSRDLHLPITKRKHSGLKEHGLTGKTF